MKRLFTILALALMVMSCVDDNTSFDVGGDSAGTGSDETTSTETAFLSLASFSVSVDDSNEMVSATRSGVSTDDYYIEVKKEDSGESAYYSKLSDVSSEPIELNVANYIIYATSYDGDGMPGASFDGFHYAGYERATLVANKTYEVDDITCYVANIEVILNMSADLKDLFKSDEELEDGDTAYCITLSMGDDYIEYDYNETRNSYFAPSDGVETLEIEIVGTYDASAEDEEANYIPVVWRSSVSNVVVGQSREVKIVINNFDSGNVEITFDVQDWILDELLSVNSFSYTMYTAMEDAIYDPDASLSDPNSPVLTLETGDIASPYELSADMFNFDEEWYSPMYRAYLTPTSGSTVDRVVITPSEITDQLATALTSVGLSSTSAIELWSRTGGVNSLLSAYLSVTEDTSTKVLTVTLKYTGAEGFIDYIGDHSFMVSATDSENRTSQTEASFTVTPAGGPEVLWLDSEGNEYSFDNRYEIYTYTYTPDPDNPDGEYLAVNPNMDVIIQMSSEDAAGITGLSISINSTVLSETELGGLGLSQNMDLVNTSGQEESALQGLGFPTGDAIVGQTTLTFDITDFMPMLAMISTDGSETDFVLTVKDATGTNVKTLMFKVKL